MNHKPQLIDLYDELNTIIDDLAPTLENLANQPGKGDSVAEYDIIEMFHKASHALWDYMHLCERRTAKVRPEPEPPGMDKLERDPHFPMKRFKRLLVRFAKAAFDDDDLNKHHDHIEVSIGDGDGSHVSQEVVYWRNDHGVKRYAGDYDSQDATATDDIELPEPQTAKA